MQKGCLYLVIIILPGPFDVKLSVVMISVMYDIVPDDCACMENYKTDYQIINNIIFKRAI